MENLAQYIKTLYGSQTLKFIQGKRLLFQPFLQDDYGKDNDCTLTSIASILHYYDYGEMDFLYPKVEKIAEQYFYNGDTYGTIPIFINKIFSKAADRKTTSKYLKSIVFNFKTIQNLIDNNIPVLLNLHDDGVDNYENHSVVIFGYTVHKIDNNKEIYTLLIYDNWSKEINWIIYNKLSIISSISYLIYDLLRGEPQHFSLLSHSFSELKRRCG